MLKYDMQLEATDVDAGVQRQYVQCLKESFYGFRPQSSQRSDENHRLELLRLCDNRNKRRDFLPVTLRRCDGFQFSLRMSHMVGSHRLSEVSLVCQGTKSGSDHQCNNLRSPKQLQPDQLLSETTSHSIIYCCKIWKHDSETARPV